MEGGTGKDSYHRNSALQAQGLKNVEESIKHALISNSPLLDPSLEVVKIADLGCASGSNSINAMALVAREITEMRKSQSLAPVEIEAVFSDLIANDFNTLFGLVPNLQGDPMFFSGVPGSFYGRLFPRSSIHFAMTSYALHYLSKVPEAVADRNSTAWNKDAVFVDRSSPAAAIAAFAEQAADDLQKFLQCRAQELISGGTLLMVFPVRLTEELNDSYQPFRLAWKDLIKEGLASQECLDSFNFPAYLRNLDEVKAALEFVESDFKVIRLQNLVFPRSESADKTAAMKNWKVVSKRFVLEHIGNEQLVEKIYDRMLSIEVPPSPVSQDLDLILLTLVKT